MFKIGLLGCGTVASYGHLPAIRATRGLRLAAVCDPNPDRAAQAARQHGLPPQQTFDDLEAFFASGLDAVAITSPAPAHMANVLQAARHRLHVLCEKPLAMNDAQARRMIQAMTQARRLLAVGFTYRFSPVALKIRQLVQQKVIGRVHSLRLIYTWDCHGQCHRAGPNKGQLNLRRRGRMLEGGPMVDCGTHQIDLARWWLDSPVVRAHGEGAWLDRYEAPDHTWLHLDHACGAHTVVEISYSYAHTTRQPRSVFQYELIGTRGLIRYDREAHLFEVLTPRGTRRLPPGHEKNFEGMYTAFARALATGRLGLLASAQDGQITTRLALTGTRQAIRQRAVNGAKGRQLDAEA